MKDCKILSDDLTYKIWKPFKLTAADAMYKWNIFRRYFTDETFVEMNCSGSVFF